jgi:hypothetical protein
VIGTIPGLGDTTVDTSPVLNEEEFAKHVRQRLAAYKNDLEKVGDGRFRKTENFKRTEFFLSSQGQPEQYITLISEIAEGMRKSKSEKTRERYVQLARQATAYLLDHAILAEKEKTLPPVVEALKKANEKLKKEGLKASEWLQTWNATDWKTWFSSKAAADYLKIVK